MRSFSLFSRHLPSLLFFSKSCRSSCFTNPCYCSWAHCCSPLNACLLACFSSWSHCCCSLVVIFLLFLHVTRFVVLVVILLLVLVLVLPLPSIHVLIPPLLFLHSLDPFFAYMLLLTWSSSRRSWWWCWLCRLCGDVGVGARFDMLLVLSSSSSWRFSCSSSFRCPLRARFVVLMPESLCLHVGARFVILLMIFLLQLAWMT